MRYSRTLTLAFQDLGSHAFRSFLTALGVIFGVGAVVAMMAISEGASQASLDAIAAQGIDNIEIRSRRPTAIAAVQSGQDAPLKYGINEQDIQHISDRYDNVLQMVPIKDTRKEVFINGVTSEVRVLATTPEFLELTRSHLVDSRSRFLEDRDGEDGLGACVVGVNAARSLFGFRDPLGETLSIGQRVFRVVGVLGNRFERRLADGVHVTRCVFIHIDTANAQFGRVATRTMAGSRESVDLAADFLYVKVIDRERLLNTAGRLKTYFHNTHPNGDFDISVPLELFRQRQAQAARDRVQLVSIAAISLLVVGIGIMNIMLANIYERTKEIGTRRALGAKKSDILLQFLSEAVLLTSIGGAVGVGVGWGITEAMVRFEYAEFTPIITTISILLAAGVSVALGVAFGTYPAWKAANLDPITALRSD